MGFAGNEKINATKSMNLTNTTKNVTKTTKNMADVTEKMTNFTNNMTTAQNMTNLAENISSVPNPFARLKGRVNTDPYSNNMSHPPDEVYLTTDS